MDCFCWNIFTRFINSLPIVTVILYRISVIALVAANMNWNYPWGNIIYKATVNSDFEKKFYISSCSTQFRYANFKNLSKVVYENETVLPKYACGLKRKNLDFKITWEVLKRAQPIADGNNPVSRLCLKELTAFVYDEKGRLFKLEEQIHIVFCQHMKKLLLKHKNFEVFYSHLVVVFVNFGCLFGYKINFCTKFCIVQNSTFTSYCVLFFV